MDGYMGGSRHWIVNTKSVVVKCHSIIWEVVFEKSAGRQTSRKLEREERREGRERKEAEGEDKSAGKQTDIWRGREEGRKEIIYWKVIYILNMSFARNKCKCNLCA